MPDCFLCGEKATQWILWGDKVICLDMDHDISTITDPIIKAFLQTKKK